MRTLFLLGVWFARYTHAFCLGGSLARRLMSIGASNDDDDSDLIVSSSLPKIIQTKGVPLHIYTEELEPKALEQSIRLAESPIPVDHVSIMADGHMGKGVTVGTVFASDKYVCPNAVGVGKLL